MTGSLIAGTLLCVATVLIHLAGLTGLIVAMRSRARTIKPFKSTVRQMALILCVVLALLAIHAVEIWVYALAFLYVGAFDSFEMALYYSTSSFTTVGYGDVKPLVEWRLLGAIESANGFLLIGWSTAFLISVVSRLRVVEFEWLENRNPAIDSDPGKDAP